MESSIEFNSSAGGCVHSTPISTEKSERWQLCGQMCHHLQSDASALRSLQLKKLAEETRKRKREAEEGRLPVRPFAQLEDFLQFDQSLESDAVMQNICSKEFVNTSWRLLLSDKVANRCSWTGIRKKKCIRDLRITLAIRTAFLRTFDDEEVFIDKTQLFFRCALDRIMKKS
ncbi:hypothetical protein ACLKA6_011985 [Drosophila palustris]